MSNKNCKNYPGQVLTPFGMSCLSLLPQSITYHSHIIFQLLQSNFTFLQRLQGAPVEEEKFHPHQPPNRDFSWSSCSLSTRDNLWQQGWGPTTDFCHSWENWQESYRLEGSVRISKRLFILLRSFFLSETVWETNTDYKKSFHSCRQRYNQKWKHEPILKKVVRIKDLSANPKYIQSMNSTCFKTIRSKKNWWEFKNKGFAHSSH